MTCPICSKTPHPKYRPFCSRRCADVDLGKWLDGDYAIPDKTQGILAKDDEGDLPLH